MVEADDAEVLREGGGDGSSLVGDLFVGEDGTEG